MAPTEPVFCARRDVELTRFGIYKILRRHAAGWDTTGAASAWYWSTDCESVGVPMGLNPSPMITTLPQACLRSRTVRPIPVLTLVQCKIWSRGSQAKPDQARLEI